MKLNTQQEVFAALGRGEKVLMTCKESPAPSSPLSLSLCGYLSPSYFAKYDWRTVEPPKMRDLGPEDIKWDLEFRCIGWEHLGSTRPVYIGTRGIRLGHSPEHLSYAYLRENFCMRYPGTSDWVRCEKEVV